MRRLLLTLSLCLLPTLAQAYTTPTLPQLQVDTTLSSTAVTKTVCASGCDYNNSQLQTAIDDAALDTTITLQAGITYTGASGTGFTLKNKTTGSGWIIIKTNTTLPAEGVRATPTDAVNYAKILRTTVTSAAMSCEASAHHYRIIGVEFMNPGDVDISTGGGSFVNCDSGAAETTLALQAHHIIFDRVYIHGPPAAHSYGVQIGIAFAGQYEAVINSTIVDITKIASQPDAEAILNALGAGPFLYHNNFLSSAGENIFLGGGADPRIYGLIPSDITVTHNHFFLPTKWRDKPVPYVAANDYTTAPNAIRLKNLLEVKNGQRILIDGNLFENMFGNNFNGDATSLPSAQSNTALLVSPRQGRVPANNVISGAADNGAGLIRITTSGAHGLLDGRWMRIASVAGTTEANGDWTIDVISSTTFDLIGSTFVHTYTSGGVYELAPWTTVQDVTVTNNWMKNAANTFAISGYDGGTGGTTFVTTPGGRFLFANNLITGAGGYSGTGAIFTIGNQPFDLTLSHNTLASFATFGTLIGNIVFFADSSCSIHPLARFVMQDNIFLSRKYPYFCSGAGGIAAAAPGYVWNNILWAGPWPANGYTIAGMQSVDGTGNLYPVDEAAIGYTDLAAGDYSITSGPANNTASDGTDIGVDWTALQAALAGTAPPADTTAPTLMAAFPTIDLPAGTTSTTVTVTSNEAATVKYGLSDVAYGSLPSTTTANGLSFTTAAITGLTNGSSTPVYFRGQDTATNTNLSSLVVTINVAAAPGDTTAPSTVTGLLATPLTGGLSITYTWTAATDNVAVASYQLYLCTPSVCTPTVPTGGQPTSESVTVNGLTANTSYVACVKALDTSGNFSAACSATATVTTLPPLAAPAPATPTGVRTLASHPSVARGATFVWNPNTEVDLAGYRVYGRISTGVYTDVYVKQITPASAYADKTPITQFSYKYTEIGSYPSGLIQRCFGIAAFNTSDVESPKTDTCVSGVGMAARTAAGVRTPVTIGGGDLLLESGDSLGLEDASGAVRLELQGTPRSSASSRPPRN